MSVSGGRSILQPLGGKELSWGEVCMLHLTEAELSSWIQPAMSLNMSVSWNSDNLSNKVAKLRNAQQLYIEGHSSYDPGHEFFIHSLSDVAGYERRIAQIMVDDTDVDDEDSQSEDPFQSISHHFATEKLEALPADKPRDCSAMNSPRLATNIPGGERALIKLILRPCGVDEISTRKAELLRRAIEATSDSEFPAQVVVGERVSELDRFCKHLNIMDLVKTVTPRILHREDSVDVRVTMTKTFGQVVQKTYIKQTMRWPHRCHSSLQDQLLYEASILKSLADVRGVVRLLGWCYNDEESGDIVKECGRLKSLLYNFVDGNHCPKEPIKLVSYMMQLLTALNHLHDRGIVHCNVKRENVLFDGRELTLIDFETAVHEHELVDMGKEDCEEEVRVHYRSNPHFSAPEVLEVQLGKNKYGTGILYGHRRDVWSAGVILAELLLGMDTDTHLFPSGRRELRIQSRRDFCEKMDGGSGGVLAAFTGLKCYGQMPPTKFCKYGSDIVKHMTRWCRFKRISAWEALEHSFFVGDPVMDTFVEPVPGKPRLSLSESVNLHKTHIQNALTRGYTTRGACPEFEARINESNQFQCACCACQSIAEEKPRLEQQEADRLRDDVAALLHSRAIERYRLPFAMTSRHPLGRCMYNLQKCGMVMCGEKRERSI